jgi:hypothetical protein
VNEKNFNNNFTVPVADMEQNSSHGFSGKKQIKTHDSPCRIHLHSKRKRLTDADGVSGKAAIDGLVKGGILIDDSPQYVQAVSYSQEKIKKGESEETLIELWVDDNGL